MIVFIGKREEKGRMFVKATMFCVCLGKEVGGMVDKISRAVFELLTIQYLSGCM